MADTYRRDDLVDEAKNKQKSLREERRERRRKRALLRNLRRLNVRIVGTSTLITHNFSMADK